MNCQLVSRAVALLLISALPLIAAPLIDSIPAANIPAGTSLIVPVTASSPNGRPLTFTAVSSTNRILVEIHTNNPFWKMSVVQVAATNAPGAFQTPFRGGVATVTNVGDLTFMLFRDLTPHTVDVFQGLTAGGFYTSNTIFHRVVNTTFSIIQGGDPSTNGSGGPVFQYDNEFHPRALFSGSGQLALANAGKDADGSQFFVTLGPQRAFDLRYTLFGQLVRGFNVLTNLINTPTNAASRPLADVIITRASFVPDNFDTVLTLTGTNLAGVAGIISVIADDGAGGRTTNSFTATTIADTSNNEQPILYPNTVTNFVGPVNGRLTNLVSALDMEGDAIYWFKYYADQNSLVNASNTIFSLVNGQLQMVVVPNTNYVGPVAFTIVASPSSLWSSYPTLFPYDMQTYAFGIGDTVISAQVTNFTSEPLSLITNQVLATFTNGVPNSAATNFTAAINWGDNATNIGVITTNLNWKVVRGTHTYTNAGIYPVYVTVRSALGAMATVVATATIPPTVALRRTGTNNVVRWPAWAAEYQVQTNASLTATNWASPTNLPAMVGYDNVITNTATNQNLFFRLKK